MKKNKLITLLSTFSKKEMTRFGEFVQSPYFNKRIDVINLVQYLHNIYPNFTEKKCAQKKIFQEIYPTKIYNHSPLSLVFTYTFRLAKKFLNTEVYNTQPQVQSLNLLQAIHQKKQVPLYQKQFKKAQKTLEALPYRNNSFYQYQYEFTKIAELENQFNSWQGLTGNQLINVHSLDYFYISEKLRTACELKVRSEILQSPFNSPLLAPIIVAVQKDWKSYQKIPSIVVYYHLYNMLVEEDTKYYYKVLPIIEQHNTFFPRIELQEIYTYIQNYCIKQINKNKEEFMQELLNIYKIQLNRRFLHDAHGQLSEWHYKNIVTLGLRLEAVEWVNKFIESYKKDLQIECRANAYRFNRAAFDYHTGAYESVLKLLLNVEHSNVQYSLGTRWLLLRTYYELEEKDAFFSLCDSFRIYLQRHQLISDFKKKGNKQAIRFIRKLFQLKLTGSYKEPIKTTKKWLKLKQEIKDTKVLFNRKWLENKLLEMKNDEFGEGTKMDVLS